MATAVDVAVTFIATLPATIAAIAAAIVAVRTLTSVQRVEKKTDGMSSDLVAATRESALREGADKPRRARRKRSAKNRDVQARRHDEAAAPLLDDAAPPETPK